MIMKLIYSLFLTCVSLIGAEPGAIEQQQLQPEDVIHHEQQQHEDQSHAQTAAQLHRRQRHWNTPGGQYLSR